MRHRWLVVQLNTARHQRMLKDMAAAAEPWAVAATAISKAAVERAARLAATVLASVAENKCDDLAAMYQLLLGPGPAQERMAAGVASCGAALPSLSPTEVYTEAGDPGPGLDPAAHSLHTAPQGDSAPDKLAPEPAPRLQQTSLFLILLYTSLLCLGSADSATHN